MAQFLDGYIPPPVLVTRDHRRLTDEEVRAVVAEAKRDGLIVAADNWSLAPSDLYRACVE